MANKVSIAVIRRLPKYYRYINDLFEKGVQRVSSKILAENMGLTASQVRQDFSCFGGFGQQGYGYNVEGLRGELGQILKLNAGYKGILVGVGNLGLALINNFDFAKNGFTLIGAFDNSPAKIGTRVHGVTIRDVSELESFCGQEKPDIAVLTCPSSAAEPLAHRLMDIGIRGLWNFTNVDLYAADQSVVLENVHLSDSLMTLSCRIEN